MLLKSINLNKIFFIIIFYADLTYSITVEYATCERVNITQVYPPVQPPNLRYYLFTKLNTIEGQELIVDNVTSVQNSNFNSSWPTRIIIGGWKVTVYNCKTTYLKDTYLTVGDFNVILVDTFDFSSQEYPLAVFSVNKCGELLGNFTKFLNNKFNVSYNDIYLIGHSLGAWMAAAAGRSITPNLFNTNILLDPSNLGNVAEYGNLDQLGLVRGTSAGAVYVLVIRTDMFFLGDGLPIPYANATFYPHNGKRNQPPCDLTQYPCSAGMAVDYLIHSITSPNMYCGIITSYALAAASIGPFGSTCSAFLVSEPSRKITGEFYVAINASHPNPV